MPMHRLDDLSIDNVGFIKIDVEGHEESVVIEPSKPFDGAGRFF